MKSIKILALSVVALTFGMISLSVYAGSPFGLGFNAPTINGASNVTNPVVGEIVYDDSDDSFKGYFSNSTWATLGNGSSASDSSKDLINLGLSATVASNALTIALKSKGGADPSSSDPVKIGFRNSTLSNGTYSEGTVDSSLSVVLSSGSTLGLGDSKTYFLNVYALNNSGTVELAVSPVVLDEGKLHSSAAEGGAGSADSNHVLYSTASRSNLPARLIGMVEIVTGASHSGGTTWVNSPTRTSVAPFETKADSFRAIGSNTTLTSSATVTVKFNGNVDYDYRNGYDPSTGLFTASESGLYEFHCTLRLNTFAAASVTNTWEPYFYKNGSTRFGGSLLTAYTTSSVERVIAMEAKIELSPGDTVEVQSYQNYGATPTIQSSNELSHFEGRRIK